MLRHIRTDFTTDHAELSRWLDRAVLYDVIGAGDQSERNTFNAIMHAAATNSFRKDKYTRRLVMVITDDIGGFGPGNDVDPYFADCPQTRPTQQQFSKAVQEAEVGIIYSVSGHGWNPDVNNKVDLVRGLFGQTTVTDYTVDGNSVDEPWNGVSWHLVYLLGSGHIGWTSTTTIKTTTQSYKVNPDRDIEIQFLLDAATDDRQGYHLSFGTQMMINQLEDLYKAVLNKGYTLRVGATVFGALDTCTRSIMEFTPEYKQVRKEMSNPPTFDQSAVQGGVNRNTYNALRYATENFNQADSVRRLLILLTDHMPVFGDGNPRVPGSCIQQQPSADELKTSIEGSRSGLLINIFAQSLDQAEKRKAYFKSIVDAAGLTDISYNADSSKQDWDAIKFHAAKMISKEWTATTSTAP